MNVDIRLITGVDEAELAELAALTGWMYGWWGESEGYSYDAVRLYMLNSMQAERLPKTFGLYLGDELIGLYQFRLDDLFVRPDIYPWLANVYIHAPYRGKGCGRQLMQSIRGNAEKHLPFDELYLYTVHTGLYEKYGWEFIGETDTHLERCRIQRLYRLRL